MVCSSQAFCSKCCICKVINPPRGMYIKMGDVIGVFYICIHNHPNETESRSVYRPISDMGRVILTQQRNAHLAIALKTSNCSR